MRRLTGALFDRPWTVIACWLLALAGLLGAAAAIGADYEFDVNLDTTESVRGLDLLAAHDPALEGSRFTIAWSADAGVRDPAVEARVAEVLADVAEVPEVSGVVSPYADPRAAATQVSADGRIAYATVATADVDVPDASVLAIMEAVEQANGGGLTIGVTGSPIKQAAPPGVSSSEAFGFAAAAVILLLAFGSLVAAAIPLATAIVALGAALAAVELVTHAIAIPSFAPQMVSLLSIGVGIDYALFVVSRHRSGLMRGMPVRASVLHAFDTSGRAVLFAGITVLIALLGMVATGIGFLAGLAVASSIGVLFTMLVTVTLLPALLRLLGVHVLGRRAQRDLAANGPHDDERSTRWGEWAQMIQRRPWPFIVVAIGVLLALTLPAAVLRLGMSDAGAEPGGSTERIAYDLVAEGFGAGANGPLLLVSEDAAALADVLPGVAGLEGVAYASEPMTTPDGAVAFATIIPTAGPQDAVTADLVTTLREETLAGATTPVLVSGLTAIYHDFAAELQSRLPWFLVGVLGLSSLLLMVAFRSLAIPAKAALMNLLAAGATFGVLVAVAQWGWLAGLLGFESTGPIDPYLPILLLAVLFGLSMDYQVFLVSRIREEWVRAGDNTRAVTLGLSETGRVITAAALIMIAVFASFVFADDRIIKVIGLGLAVAIFLDAFVIRSLLVPALMRVLGDWNWWLPAWLARVTPRVTIEPADQVPVEQ